ncbi:group 1 truncated hemoglobin [Simiduia sp. 21SJ11W-1]|uniref:group I truncated hemoglobin n=1 Tax=Simiduia sp. 21SJ11W-1 TaxID=2909669 RepID=UPI0020A02AAC|nr:group 1 truncated hemoglobin [Simiduia sp. 21SJ11W-1]UTA48104.1 group 1 truncated hemoglobin [Simiduia sp. 21SJ11W-1]
MAAGLALAACVQAPHNQDANSLYQRLGKTPGISALVDNFLYEIGDSELLRPHFEQTDLERFREKLIEQLCEVSGGPCEYTGDSMQEVHSGMAINNRHFDATVAALIRAMNATGIDVASQNALLKRLAAMHPEVMAETLD